MNLVVLTGAGLSAESGLGTFRDPKGSGLWDRFNPMELATPQAFARDPDLVQEFYSLRRRNLVGAEPNAAHRALARLQTELAARDGEAVLVTQNIDDLLERAGAARVIHMHGELFKARCTGCAAVSMWHEDLGRDDACPACGVTGRLRPHVVWFGEMPFHMDEIEAALNTADRFAAIGTSGSVYPAAGFVGLARARGIHTAEINLDPSDNAELFDDHLYGPATETVSRWVDAILREA